MVAEVDPWVFREDPGGPRPRPMKLIGQDAQRCRIDPSVDSSFLELGRHSYGSVQTAVASHRDQPQWTFLILIHSTTLLESPSCSPRKTIDYDQRGLKDNASLLLGCQELVAEFSQLPGPILHVLCAG